MEELIHCKFPFNLIMLIFYIESQYFCNNSLYGNIEMDVLVVGKKLEVYELSKEIESLENRVVCLNDLTDLFTLDDDERFDLIIFDEEICEELTRDELEKVKVLRGKGYGTPIVAFVKDESGEVDFRKKGFSKIIPWSHPTEELERFLIEVYMGRVDF